VSLGGDRGGPVESLPATETADPRPLDEWIERFRRGAAQAFDTDLARSLLARIGAGTDPADAERASEALPLSLTKLDVMNQSLEAMQSLVTRYRLAAFSPDVLVTIPKDACRTTDFHRAAPMIALGRALTAQALDEAGLSSVTR
jgi:NTE family protein